MSTTPLTDAINALTQYANETTGASDTTLSDAVGTLVAGYGGGGGWTADGIATNAEPNGIITLGSSITTISSYALYSKPITQISGIGVTTIQTSALQDCRSLVSASFPNLTTIQSNGMQDARALTSFYAPNLTRAEGNALRYWTSYTGAIIFPSLTYFGNCYGSAFSQIRFPSLTTLQGGDNFRNCREVKVIDCGSVTSIPYESTFTECNVLEVLILRRTNAITSLGRGSWGTGQKTLYDGTCKIYVPSALVSTYISATNWSNLPHASTQFVALEGSPYEQPDFEYNE